MHTWQLWRRGEAITILPDIPVFLESWNAKSDPAQMRLQAYLQEVPGQIDRHLPSAGPLYLDMQIDIPRLRSGDDLENYLTPLVRTLGPQRFVFVSASKRTLAQPSKNSRAMGTITVGYAEAWDWRRELQDWHHGQCSVQSSGQIKQQMWQTLCEQGSSVAPAISVECHMAWHCSSGRGWHQPRNWTSLWKPTGDAMGPVLGPERCRDATDPNRYHPDDDRISKLSSHLDVDDAMKYAIDSGLWWRLAT